MDESRQRMLTSPPFRLIRWTVPWLLLGVIAYAVWGVASDFQAEKSRAAAQSATGTVEATSVAAAAGSVGTTLVDGVHLRDTPTSGGTVLKDLSKGVFVQVIESRAGWLKVREPGGTVGWMTADASFIEVKKK